MFKKKNFNYKPAQPIRFNCHNSYPILIPKDTLCRANLQILTNSEFKRVLEKVTKDLNLLLHMTDSQFWRQFAENQTLNLCLESCLSVFSKRQYDRYQLNGNNMMETIPQKDSSFVVYSALLKIVLFVYYRASSASIHKQKEILYQQWLLDIPKMLDLAGIYGDSNPEIVKKIISNVYESIEEYDRDTLDFFTMIEHHFLLKPKQSEYVDINFTTKSLRARNYGNRQNFMMQETAKEFFKVKDLLLNLINFLRYFPKKYVNEFVVDYKIQEKLLMAMAAFLRESHDVWKLEGYIKYFQEHFEDVRQKIASYFVQIFKLLRGILQGIEKGITIEIAELAQSTYEALCLCLTEKQKQPQFVYLRRIINHLFEESQDKIFFLLANKLQKINKKTQNSIKECVRYENEYRKEKRLAGSEFEMDETYEKFKESINKYKDLVAHKDGDQVKKLEKQRQEQRLQREPLTGEQFWNITKLKHAPINIQYEDEPDQDGQFCRVEVQHYSSAQSIDLSIFVGNNGRVIKQKKNDGTDLSVWSLSQLSQQEDQKKLLKKKNQPQVDFDQTHLMGFELAKQIKKFVNSKQLSISHCLQDKENKISNKQVDLSIFNINRDKENKHGLSFSMLSQIQAKDDKTDDIFNFMGSSDLDDKNQLANIIADMSGQVSTGMTTGLTGQKSLLKAYDEKQNDKAEFEMFQWESQNELSFEISNY